MPNTKLSELSIGLHSLTVFKALKNDPVIKALMTFLDNVDDVTTAEAVELYSNVASNLYAANEENLSDYVKTIVGNDENIYIRDIGQGITPTTLLKKNVERELEILQNVANLTASELRQCVAWTEYLPGWNNPKVDLKEIYKDRTKNISKYGYGMYAQYHMFFIDKNNAIVPVKNPDPIRLSDLINYKREQGIILDNTKALLENKPASNILLTGDAGTGKSSTIKAVCNELYTEGLRILEVRKEQLREIPGILDELAVNPLKFIIFIDDLSFAKNDDNYTALKAILEGSISAKSKNVVIYATSNRRHIINEKFSDRDDDVSKNDSMQESVSLSERFGIQIWFQRPDKQTYLDIVTHLLDAHKIKYDVEKVKIEAEKFALSRANRSARAAKQFVDQVLTEAISVK